MLLQEAHCPPCFPHCLRRVTYICANHAFPSPGNEGAVAQVLGGEYRDALGVRVTSGVSGRDSSTSHYLSVVVVALSVPVPVPVAVAIPVAVVIVFVVVTVVVVIMVVVTHVLAVFAAVVAEVEVVVCCRCCHCCCCP